MIEDDQITTKQVTTERLNTELEKKIREIVLLEVMVYCQGKINELKKED